MPEFLALIRRGIRLPPSGWTLAAMLAFYVLAGLFGRDPWKGEDAIHIGTAWHMLQHGQWLTPELAGRAFQSLERLECVRQTFIRAFSRSRRRRIPPRRRHLRH